MGMRRELIVAARAGRATVGSLLLVLALVAELFAGVSPGGVMVCVHRDGAAEVELTVASRCLDCCGGVAARERPCEGRARFAPHAASGCAGCRDEPLGLVRLPLGARKIDLDVVGANAIVVAHAPPLGLDAAAPPGATSVGFERVRPPPDPPPLLVRTVVFRC